MTSMVQRICLLKHPFNLIRTLLSLCSPIAYPICYLLASEEHDDGQGPSKGLRTLDKSTVLGVG